jgi:hypothetical protein
MQAQARRFHWDARKKKYVQLRGQDAVAGQAGRRVRTESGRTALVGGKKPHGGKVSKASEGGGSAWCELQPGSAGGAAELVRLRCAAG